MPDRTVIANITLTLDGHTTGPGGAYDMSCIAPYGVSDEARDTLTTMTTATTVLLGRKNYEGFGSWWPKVADDPGAEPRDRRFAQWLDTVDKVVFSTSPLQVPWQHSRRADLGPSRRSTSSAATAGTPATSGCSAASRSSASSSRWTRWTGSRSPWHPRSSAAVTAPSARLRPRCDGP